MQLQRLAKKPTRNSAILTHWIGLFSRMVENSVRWQNFTLFIFCSTDGAVSGGSRVPSSVQHIDVHRRGTDGKTAESDLPASESDLHPCRHQVITTYTSHSRRHRSVLR